MFHVYENIKPIESVIAGKLQASINTSHPTQPLQFSDSQKRSFKRKYMVSVSDPSPLTHSNLTLCNRTALVKGAGASPGQPWASNHYLQHQTSPLLWYAIPIDSLYLYLAFSLLCSLALFRLFFFPHGLEYRTQDSSFYHFHPFPHFLSSLLLYSFWIPDTSKSPSLTYTYH